MPVIDTSFLMAVFDEEHPRHKQAHRLLRKASVLHVSGGVMGEFITIVRRRANDVGLDGEAVARDLLEQVESLRIMRHAGLEAPLEVSRIYRENKGLSYVDAWGIALAKGRKEELYSFDRKQRAVHRKEVDDGQGGSQSGRFTP